MWSIFASSTRRRVSSLMTRASPQRRPVTPPSPSSMATRASSCTAVIQSISLAGKSHYLEVCYLLLYGELPTAAQLEDFEGRVTNHTMIHEQMANFFRGFRRDAHPMAIITGVVGAMSAFYHDSTGHHRPMAARSRINPDDRQDADHRCDGL